MTLRVIDGGLATELETRGHDLSDRLWSARLLVDDPAAIEEVHLAYFRAGAQVATTASYQATVQGFQAIGLGREEAIAAIGRSVDLARRARDRYAAEAGSADSAGSAGADLLVAGSVGPYGAMLADGSEYTGDYDPGDAGFRDVHRARMETLLESGVDLLAIETIPTVREARVLVDLVDELGAKAWLSFQCRDDATTAAGEPISEAVALARAAAGIVAVGVNCTAPRHVPSLLATMGSLTDLPLIAYPNAGDRWDADARRWMAASGDRYDPATVATWSGLGASWLGGCCGTGPDDIAALSMAIRALD